MHPSLRILLTGALDYLQGPAALAALEHLTGDMSQRDPRELSHAVRFDIHHPDLLTFAAHHPHAGVRIAAVSNPHLPQQVRHQLLDDVDIDVAIRAGWQHSCDGVTGDAQHDLADLVGQVHRRWNDTACQHAVDVLTSYQYTPQGQAAAAFVLACKPSLDFRHQKALLKVAGLQALRSMTQVPVKRRAHLLAWWVSDAGWAGFDTYASQTVAASFPGVLTEDMVARLAGSKDQSHRRLAAASTDATSRALHQLAVDRHVDVAWQAANNPRATADHAEAYLIALNNTRSAHRTRCDYIVLTRRHPELVQRAAPALGLAHIPVIDERRLVDLLDPGHPGHVDMVTMLERHNDQPSREFLLASRSWITSSVDAEVWYERALRYGGLNAQDFLQLPLRHLCVMGPGSEAGPMSNDLRRSVGRLAAQILQEPAGRYPYLIGWLDAVAGSSPAALHELLDAFHSSHQDSPARRPGRAARSSGPRPGRQVADQCSIADHPAQFPA